MLSNKLLSAINTSGGPPPEETSMVLEFNTALGDGTTTIGVPLSGTVNVVVDWGDGSTDTYTTEGYKTHTYSAGGIYTVKISGSLTQYGGYELTAVHNNKITKCTSFGNLGIASLDLAFNNAVNLTNVPSVLPSTVTNLGSGWGLTTGSTIGITSGGGCFFGCTSLNDPNISLWDTTNVTSMNTVFGLATSFNQPLNSWNVSNVTTMIGMFSRAYAFNQPLNSWNVSNVTNMKAMFSGIYNTSSATYTTFNQDISSWDTSNVTDISYMFLCNNQFNQNISSWDTSKILAGTTSGMISTFMLASSFNQNLNSWSVGSYGYAPLNFNALNSGFLTSNHPLWGYHPGFTTSGTFSFVNSFFGTNSVSASSLQAGDILIGLSFRDGSNTPPSLPSGWTNVTSGSGATCSIRVAYFIATGTTNSSTWTNATTAIVLVYRGSFDASKIVATVVNTGTNIGTTAKYSQNSAYRNLARTIAFVGGRDTSPDLTTPPTGLTLRRSVTDTTDEAAAFDSANLDGGFFEQSVNIVLSGTTLTVVLRLPNVMVAA